MSKRRQGFFEIRHPEKTPLSFSSSVLLSGNVESFALRCALIEIWASKVAYHSHFLQKPEFLKIYFGLALYWTTQASYTRKTIYTSDPWAEPDLKLQ